MTLRARIIWHVAFYLLALIAYFLLADGHGRFELLTRLMVFLWPLVIAIDVFVANRKPK